MADSRTSAQRLVDQGRVLVAGSPAVKAARLVAPEEPITLTGPPPRYVGRGAEKLEAALAGFGIDPTDRVALDAGASTGGFTDCLLQHGATRVVAVDVGRGQLHERLRRDPRVEVRERTDIRALATSDGQLGDDRRFSLVVADLSFISLRSVAAALLALAEPDADLVVLVKPQFEAGRAEVSRGRGVIRDPEVWRSALTGAINAMETAGAANMGTMVSPLRGADGNVEFLTWFRAVGARTTPRPDEAVAADADTAVQVAQAAQTGGTGAGPTGAGPTGAGPTGAGRTGAGGGDGIEARGTGGAGD